MKTPTNYYQFPTIRKYRRQTRKASSWGEKGIRTSLILKDEQGQNIAKVRRVLGRIRTKDNGK